MKVADIGFLKARSPMQLPNLIYLESPTLVSLHFALNAVAYIMATSKDYWKHELKKDHEGNLAKICIRCMDKSKGNFLDPEFVPLVIKFLWSNYEVDSEYLPSGLCENCRLVLQAQGKI